MSSALEILESHLEKFIENVRQMGIIVSDFQPQGQSVLNQKINSMVHEMQEIERCKSHVADVQVPLEVFEYVLLGFEFTFLQRNNIAYGSCCVQYVAVKKIENIARAFDPCKKVAYIDQGRNPHLYTKDCMEKALAKNEQVKGKIDAYRKFKAQLLVELTKGFPNEIAKYRAVRGDDRPAMP